MKKQITLKKMALLVVVLLWGMTANALTYTVGAAGTNTGTSWTTIAGAYGAITSPLTSAAIIELQSDYAGESYPITLGAKTATITVTTTSGQTAANIATGAGSLVNGTTYYLSGNGITAGTTFTYGGAAAITLSANATATNSTAVSMSVWNNNPITIRPAATVNVTLTGSGSTTGMFTFDGAKFVTIDGQAGGTGGNKNLTITNPNTAATAYTIKLQNDASYNTIKYCKVTGSAKSTTSNPATGTIYIGGTTVTPAIAQTGAYPNLFGSGNHSNTIDNCDIGNASGGLPTVGVYTLGTSTSVNSGNTISNCNVYNCFNPGAFISAGMYLDNYSNDTNVRNNKIYQDNTSYTYTSDGGLYYGIYNIYNHRDISGNIIGYASNSQTGTMTIDGGKSCRFIGIYLFRAVAGTSNGNIIANIDVTSSSAGAANSGVVTGMLINNNFTAATLANPNVIHDITVRPSVSTTSTLGYSTLCGISVTGGSSTNIVYANLYNLNVIPTTANVSGILTGIYSAGTNIFTIKLSQIHDLTCAPVSVNSTVAQTVSGIVSGAGGNAANTVERNLVYNLNAYTSSIPTIVGIQSTGNSTLGVTFKNNIVRLGTDVTTDAIIYGLYQSATVASSKIWFYNNSVFIGGTAPAIATQNSFGFYTSATLTTSTNNDIENNIFVNQRINASGPARHYALGYTTAAVIKLCDYNLYSASPLGLAVATDQTTLTNFAYSSSDTHSLTGTPGFKNPTASTPDLTYYTTINKVDGVGLNLASATPAVTDDYAGTSRGTSNDIGAYNYTASGTPVSTTISSTGSPATDNPISLTIQFGAAVTGFDITDLVVKNGTASNLATTDGGTTYTVNITPTGSAISVDIPAGVAVNGSNANSQATQWSVAYNAVTVTGGTTASYSTLKAAFDAINLGTHTGAINIALNTGTTETATAVLNASGTGSPASSYTAVNIYPTVSGVVVGGNLPAPLIDLNGADNVTINGSVNQGNGAKSLTIINTSTSTTAGTSTIRMYNDACTNTVKYCTLKGSAQIGTGAVVLIGAGATGGSGNDVITIQNNDITTAVGAAASRPWNSILCAGQTQALSNDNITIQNNNIYDFLNSANGSQGINFNAYSSTVSISGNSFYETTSFAPTSTATYYAIVCNWVGLLGITISDNFIGGSAAQGLGTWTKTNSNNNGFNGIFYNGTVTGTAASIQNNTIKNFNYSNSAGGSFIGFQLAGGKVNIGTTTGNTIGSASGNGSITYTSVNGNFYGINIASTALGAVDCQNNTIASITATAAAASYSNIRCIEVIRAETINVSKNIIGSSTTNSIYASSTSTGQAQQVYGINLTTGTTVTASGNTINNLTNNVSGGGSASQIIGINSAVAGTQTISDNAISNISINNPSGSTTQTTCGIKVINAATVGNTITGNTISGISSTSASFAKEIYGIYYSGNSTGTNTVSRNNIYGLSVDAGTTAASLYGIYIATGTTTYANNLINLGGTTQSSLYGIYETGAASNNNSLYHNSVYIGGTPTTGALNSFALNSAASTNTRDFRNNIFVNARAYSGAKNYAAYFGYAVSTGLTLSNNLYYAPNAGGVLGYYNALDVTSTPLIIGMDAGSVNANPLFVNPTAATPDMSIQTYSSAVESKGAAIAAVTTDYLGLVTRSATTPDLGAYEFTYASAASDNYRSLITGNWGTVGTWQTSPDNTTWATATSAPTSAAASVLIQNGHLVTILADATASALTVNGGGQLSLNSGSSLLAASLNINSDGNGTGTFVDLNTNGNLTVTGTTNVYQTLTGATGASHRAYWYLSSPVSTAKASVFDVASGTNKMTRYDETIPGYVTQFSDNNTALTPGTGYVTYIGGADATYKFSGGNLNNGDVPVSVTRTGTDAGKRGFNLVGNPYPSYLNWASTDIVKTNLRSTIWYRTFNGTDMIFLTNDGSFGTGTSSAYIPPMQAFWVRVDADNTPATLKFVNSARSHQDQSIATNRLRAPKVNTAQVVRLQVSNGINTDESIIVADPTALDGFDSYDSQKMSNANVNIPEIYTLAGSEELVINHMNNLSVNKELPLGFRTGASNAFCIKASQVSNLDAGMKVILKDNVLNTEQDITDGTPYNFSSDVTNSSSRFTIVFRTASIATGINPAENNSENLFVYKNAANQIVVNREKSLDQQGIVTVCNAIGQKLLSTSTTGTITVIKKAFTSGVYFVTVNVAGKNTTKKVVVS